MRNRWLWFGLCTILGVAAIVCGLKVPAHLNAVDSRVIARAGLGTPDFTTHGLELAKDHQLGAAQMLLGAANQLEVPRRETLATAVGLLEQGNPGLRPWGAPEPPFAEAITSNASTSAPLAALVIRLENRERLLWFLGGSSHVGVQQLIRFLRATNTVIFPPSESASGQALDAAVSIAGVLMERGRLSSGLSSELFTMASQANRGESTQPLEETLMDLLSLGQRMNWGQLATFVSGIEDTRTLRVLAGNARQANEQLPVLFSAVIVSKRPAAIARYLTNFNETAMADIGQSLRHGEGGLKELLARNERISAGRFGGPLLTGLSLRAPRVALTLKWFLYFAGGTLLAAAAHFARPGVSELERPLQVRGFHFAREFLFGLGFLFVVLLFSEPFLAEKSQEVDFHFQLRLPTVGSVVSGESSEKPEPFMNREVLLTMLLFFVLQSLLYAACLFKLAEIRRQRVAPRMKLRLLENEEHLFDAGLYLGFLGTIVSLVLVSLGVFRQPSLMAAYSSTSFGILFVVLFKVVHLRPTRRRLLLEADAPMPAQRVEAPAHKLAAPL